MHKTCERCGTNVPFFEPRQRVAGLKVCSVCAEDDYKVEMQRIAHDSGDGETVYHCCFCGSGNVTARSDGSAECGFCSQVFTVQVQPTHPYTPQTIDGKPYDNPDMPGQVTDPSMGPGELPADEVGDNSLTFNPEGAPTFDPPAQPEQLDQPELEPVAASYFLNTTGDVLAKEAMVKHLALVHADDRQATLKQVRASNVGG